MVNYKLLHDRLKVIDSYLIKKSDFDKELDYLWSQTPESPLWTSRGRRFLKCEWQVHNVLYKLGIKREKTADVDFEFKQGKFLQLGYIILGSILMI